MAKTVPVAATPSVERVSDFIASLGVNTKLGQAGESAAAVMADMAYLGLSHVRNVEITPATSTAGLANYGKLADAGIKFDWLTGGAKVSTTAALQANLKALDTFVKAHPGAIAAIEGPNEINNFPVTFNSLTGRAAAISYQQALYTAVKADPLTAAIPVLNFTDDAPTVGAADGMNAHPYPDNGAQPLARLTAVSAKQAAAAVKPLYLTEAGYASLPGMHGREGVDETTQAKLSLNLIMDAARLGVAATYLYDLVDDAADPNGATAGDHFGLFATGGRAKPVATAIHNLTSILADPGAGAGSFTPTTPNVAISGLPSTGSSLVLEKSSGVYDVVLWTEPSIWDASRHKAATAASQSVELDFAQGFSQAKVFDPLTSSSAVRTVAGASSVTVSVSDHPIIVEVSSLVQAMASVSGATGSAPLAATLTPAATAPTLASPSH